MEVIKMILAHNNHIFLEKCEREFLKIQFSVWISSCSDITVLQWFQNQYGVQQTKSRCLAPRQVDEMEIIYLFSFCAIYWRVKAK